MISLLLKYLQEIHHDNNQVVVLGNGAVYSLYFSLDEWDAWRDIRETWPSATGHTNVKYTM